MTVFATSYFPSAHYLKALCESENPVIDLGEHYTKQTERTRASIWTANKLHRLSIPVIKPFGNKTAVKDIKLSFAENWKRDHCRAIEAAYSSSPYYEHYAYEVFELINSDVEVLFEFNQQILMTIKKWLDLPINPTFSSIYVENKNIDYKDFRFDFNSKNYIQVDFGQKEFIENLSILDAIFCLGPLTRKLIIN